MLVLGSNNERAANCSLDDIHSSLAKLESSKAELVRSKQELEKKVTSPFTGTRSELQLAMDRHTSQLERSERRLEEVSCLGYGDSWLCTNGAHS